MSGTNQYLTFAAGVGANVLTSTAYAALSAQATGFTSGTAPSQQCNTPWRQATVGVAALAQWVVDVTGGNMMDDGSVANFEAGIVSALTTSVAAILAAGTHPIVESKTSPSITAGVVNIDFNAGNFFVVLMSAAITSLTFSNFPASGKAQEVTVVFVGDGTDHGHTFLSESLIKWLGQGVAGTAPTFLFTAGYENICVFLARDGVTTRVVGSYSGTAAA